MLERICRASGENATNGVSTERMKHNQRPKANNHVVPVSTGNADGAARFNNSVRAAFRRTISAWAQALRAGG